MIQNVLLLLIVIELGGIWWRIKSTLALSSEVKKFIPVQLREKTKFIEPESPEEVINQILK